MPQRDKNWFNNEKVLTLTDVRRYLVYIYGDEADLPEDEIFANFNSLFRGEVKSEEKEEKDAAG